MSSFHRQENYSFLWLKDGVYEYMVINFSKLNEELEKHIVDEINGQLSDGWTENYPRSIIDVYVCKNAVVLRGELIEDAYGDEEDYDIDDEYYED